MFESAFFIDAAIIFGIGLWPVLLVLAASAFRTINARRQGAVTAVANVALPHVELAPARPALAYAG